MAVCIDGMILVNTLLIAKESFVRRERFATIQVWMDGGPHASVIESNLSKAFELQQLTDLKDRAAYAGKRCELPPPKYEDQLPPPPAYDAVHPGAATDIYTIPMPYKSDEDKTDSDEGALPPPFQSDDEEPVRAAKKRGSKKAAKKKNKTAARSREAYIDIAIRVLKEEIRREMLVLTVSALSHVQCKEGSQLTWEVSFDRILLVDGREYLMVGSATMVQ